MLPLPNDLLRSFRLDTLIVNGENSITGLGSKRGTNLGPRFVMLATSNNCKQRSEVAKQAYI